MYVIKRTYLEFPASNHKALNLKHCWQFAQQKTHTHKGGVRFIMKELGLQPYHVVSWLDPSGVYLRMTVHSLPLIPLGPRTFTISGADHTYQVMLIAGRWTQKSFSSRRPKLFSVYEWGNKAPIQFVLYNNGSKMEWCRYEMLIYLSCRIVKTQWFNTVCIWMVSDKNGRFWTNITIYRTCKYLWRYNDDESGFSSYDEKCHKNANGFNMYKNYNLRY